jgi:hypothetical protein
MKHMIGMWKWSFAFYSQGIREKDMGFKWDLSASCMALVSTSFEPSNKTGILFEDYCDD